MLRGLPQGAGAQLGVGGGLGGQHQAEIRARVPLPHQVGDVEAMDDAFAFVLGKAAVIEALILSAGTIVMGQRRGRPIAEHLVRGCRKGGGGIARLAVATVKVA